MCTQKFTLIFHALAKILSKVVLHVKMQCFRIQHQSLGRFFMSHPVLWLYYMSYVCRAVWSLLCLVAVITSVSHCRYTAVSSYLKQSCYNSWCCKMVKFFYYYYLWNWPLSLMHAFDIIHKNWTLVSWIYWCWHSPSQHLVSVMLHTSDIAC